MIYPLASQLKYSAIKHPMVNMASFGDITLYDNKATIAYPYVNFDVVSSSVKDFLKTYVIRIYVCDRNQPYIAYNKCEVIMDDILKDIDIEKYFVNYFTLEFKDIVNGCWCDFEIQVKLQSSCTYDTLFDDFVLLEDGGFVLQENGDLVILQ